MHFYNFGLPVQKSSCKAEKGMKIEEILGKDVMKLLTFKHQF